MGRPATIDDAQLLDTARALFLEKGGSATTAEVARRAGVSQASIFKRYKTKQDLFLAAMQAERERRHLADELRGLIDRVGVREAMILFGVQLIEFVGRVLPLALVSWSNRGAFGLPPGAAGRGSMFRDLKEVVSQLAREMQEGRLREQDPWLLLRTFMGTIQHYVLATVVWKAHIGPQLSPEAYMRGVVDLIWSGIGPEAPRRRKP